MNRLVFLYRRFLCLLTLSISFLLVSCTNDTDAKINKLDSLCDDYVENLKKGRVHDAKEIKEKMDEYWDIMNELNENNELTEEQKKELNDIEERMFHAKWDYMPD